MNMKDVITARQEFYKQLLQDIEKAPVTFNRTVACSILTNNPYFEELDGKMVNRLLTLCQTKTNWGKNLFLQEVKECILLCLLQL